MPGQMARLVQRTGPYQLSLNLTHGIWLPPHAWRMNETIHDRLAGSDSKSLYGGTEV